MPINKPFSHYVDNNGAICLHERKTGLRDSIKIVNFDNELYCVIKLSGFNTTSRIIEFSVYVDVDGHVGYASDGKETTDFRHNKFTFEQNVRLSFDSSKKLSELRDWIRINKKVLCAYYGEIISTNMMISMLVGRGESPSLFKRIKINTLLSVKKEVGGNKVTEKTFKKLLIGVAVFAVVVVLAIASLTVITPTQRGVKITLGKAGDTVLQPGLVLKTPFVQKVKKYDLSPKTLKMNFSMGQDAAVTSDMQSVACEMVVYWTYDEVKLLEVVNGYTDSSIKSLVESNTLGAIKEVIGKYSIYDIVEKQEEVTEKVRTSLIDRLANYPVVISSLTINNWDWAEAFDAQIAETMKMAQQVKVAQQELEVTKQQSQKQVAEANAAKERAEIEARMKVTVAEQEAIALKTKVQAEADAKVIEAEAEAEARKLEGEAEASYYESLLPYREIIEATRTLDINEIEANGWDGRRVPSYVPLTANGTLVNLN